MCVCVCVEGRAFIAFSPHGHLAVIVDAGVRRLCSRLGIDRGVAWLFRHQPRLERCVILRVVRRGGCWKRVCLTSLGVKGRCSSGARLWLAHPS